MQLMVSVISAEEAWAAMEGGADILDVKNPAEGSLGAPFPHIVRQVRQHAPRPALVSAAIGDMPDLPGTAALAALGAAACGVDYVKVGLFGPQSADQAVYLLKAVQQALRDYPEVKVIAGAYADAGRAGTLHPGLLPSIAAQAGVAGCLLDTAIKDGMRLFDFLSPQALQNLASEAHAAGLLFALAGALQGEDLLVAQGLGADVVGVRTAVCQDNQRNAPLQIERVRFLRSLIASPLPIHG